MAKLNLENFLSFKPFTAQQSKLYRRKLALKIKKTFQDETLTDDEFKSDEDLATKNPHVN